MTRGLVCKFGVASLLATICWAALGAPQASATAAGGTVLQRIRQSGTVRLAYRESAVPFSYVVDGKPAGYSIDLCMRVVAAIRSALAMPGLRVAWVPVTPTTRVDAIADGTAHLECGTTTNTRERRARVAFTIPHFIAGTRMLVKAASTINDWSDIHGKTVALAAGATSRAAVERLPQTHAVDVKVMEVAEVNDAMALLDAGHVYAVVAGNVQLAGLAAAAKDPRQYAIRGAMLAIEPYAMMLPKDDAEFKTIVDRAMVASIHERETQQLYRKWFLSPIPPRNVTLDIPMGYLLMESFRFPSDKVAD
ncbi:MULTISPECIES: amino acid ABC transporter substrate-binding protein [Cupriavidus]|uniref:Amino acid ABC transporter substrate-binding protein n=1 Tax=Cupriavidus pauculus TaxID=82633 RepID=A0A5P2H3X1_9BURK|nr:amino acid ABC transporter substrate-binding protein [Cupriavidus pauculus]QET02374.1 amino acid ABC transporter substrate-binding protein [Cupriavidus pauculus]